MNEFALVISNVNPWYLAIAAVVIITIDMFFINSELLTWFGVALLLIAGGNAIDLPPIIQLWSYPVAIILVLLGQRRIGALLNRKPDPYREIESYVGQTGRLQVRKSVTDNARHFQSDSSRGVLDSVTDAGTVANQDSITILKIEFSDGKVLPAIIDDGTEPEDGMVVKVHDVQNQQLKVKRHKSVSNIMGRKS